MRFYKNRIPIRHDNFIRWKNVSTFHLSTVVHAFSTFELLQKKKKKCSFKSVVRIDRRWWGAIIRCDSSRSIIVTVGRQCRPPLTTTLRFGVVIWILDFFVLLPGDDDLSKRITLLVGNNSFYFFSYIYKQWLTHTRGRPHSTNIINCNAKQKISPKVRLTPNSKGAGTSKLFVEKKKNTTVSERWRDWKLGKIE